MKALLQSSRRGLPLAAFITVGIVLATTASFAQNAVGGKDEKKDDAKGGTTAPNPSKEQIDRIRQALEENRKRVEEAQQRAAEMAQQRGKFQRLPGRFRAEQNRLGARLQQPDDAVIAQLGLAEGNGLVLAEVPEGSVAAKAGFLASDILLKLDGKDVSSTVIEFTSALNAIKTDTPVDAVVLRKGKEETIKGIKLPEAPANPRGNPFLRRIQFNVRPATPKE